MNLEHKLIITGTGRAGTTFLVRLLTALGQPTGYDASNWRSDYFPHCTAGLERKLTDPNAPYIVKDPELCVTLEGILATERIAIDHAIVPIRDLDAATLSRVRIGGSSGSVPGGVIGTADPQQQKCVLADRFHRLLQTLVARDIPHTFLLFPRFVQDGDYAFKKLHPIFPDVTREQFDAAFREIADPSLVHSFDPNRPAASAAAREFAATQRTKRRRRHVRQISLWSSLAAAIVLGLGSRWPANVRAATAPIETETVALPNAAPNGETNLPITLPLSAMPRHHRKRGLVSLRRATASLRLSDVGQPDNRTFKSAQGAPVPAVTLSAWPEFAP